MNRYFYHSATRFRHAPARLLVDGLQETLVGYRQEPAAAAAGATVCTPSYRDAERPSATAKPEVSRCSRTYVASTTMGLTCNGDRVPLAGGGSKDRPHRTGHIAGARSVPFTTVTGDDLTMRPSPELAAAFATAGVKPGDTVIGLTHRAAGDGDALRRKDARAQRASLRRVVRGLVAAAGISGRQPVGEGTSVIRSGPRPYADPYIAGVGLGLVLPSKDRTPRIR
jgi:hypothetical protein